MDLSFKGRAKRIDDIDLPKLGARIGVGEDELHAFIDAETSGTGFDAEGRPKMLFEPHVFYRNLSGPKRDRAVKEGLAYKNWGAKPYPKDSYPRLRAAIAIDETAALKSASWGLGQVLGENHKLASHPTVQSMVVAMMDDEEEHLEASVEFIINSGLADELKAHKWEAFARGYNGPGYKKNGYHTKLADAYAKWKRIKDTPWSPTDAAPAPQVAPPASIEPSPAPVPPRAPERIPEPPVAESKPAGKGGLIGLILLGLAAAGAYLVNIPCNWFGVSCS